MSAEPLFYTIEQIAEAFHESYERQAPDFGYHTRDESAVPWSEVPEANRELMIAVARDLLRRGVIYKGAATDADDDDMAEWSDDYRATQAAEPLTDDEWWAFADALEIEESSDG